MIHDPIKSVHSKVGLLNILFTPGSSGTFLANMLAQAIRDPWWKDYVPETPNELFRVTNESLNPFNHIAMTWHPVNIPETHDVLSLTDINWINLIVTPNEAKFIKVLWAIKDKTLLMLQRKIYCIDFLMLATMSSTVCMQCKVALRQHYQFIIMY